MVEAVKGAGTRAATIQFKDTEESPNGTEEIGAAGNASERVAGPGLEAVDKRSVREFA